MQDSSKHTVVPLICRSKVDTTARLLNNLQCHHIYLTSYKNKLPTWCLLNCPTWTQLSTRTTSIYNNASATQLWCMAPLQQPVHVQAACLTRPTSMCSGVEWTSTWACMYAASTLLWQHFYAYTCMPQSVQLCAALSVNSFPKNQSVHRKALPRIQCTAISRSIKSHVSSAVAPFYQCNLPTVTGKLACKCCNRYVRSQIMTT